MVTKSEATTIVQAWLADMHISDDDEVVVSHVDEHPWGWMFFYDSKRYIETNDFRHAVAGNVPLYVTRDGLLHGPVAGSGTPSDEHLKLFEALLEKK